MPQTGLPAPTGVTVTDAPDDNGHGVTVRWSVGAEPAEFLAYEIARIPTAGAPESTWVSLGTAPAGTGEYIHRDEDETHGGKTNPKFIATGVPVQIAVRATGGGGATSEWSAPASGSPAGNWLHRGRLSLLIFTLLFAGAVIYFIQTAKSGKPLYVRPIGGIDAVDEAIGRATEMGRPILFCLGTGTAGDVATIAGFTVLSRVAKRTAEYQTPLLVPVNDPVMLAVAQETVKEGYLQAGRPEVYRPESVFYVSAMQFPYVAAVNGLMIREKTATNFYMGVFHAEALLLAEAGSAAGAIQISGTDQVSQIPFFVAATDYTLIGEELYAASAYLSQDPVLLGPLKAQDWTKLVLLAFLLIGVILATLGWDGLARLVHTA